MNDLSINNRLYLTLAIVIFCFITIYKFSFANTIDIVNEYDTNEEQIYNLNNAPKRIAFLNTEINNINKLIANNDTLGQVKENNIIDYSERKCKELDITIIELSKPFTKHHDDYIVHYHELRIQGDFFDIIRLLDDLQKQRNIPKIISVKTYSKKKKYTNDFLVYSQIIFQSIKNK